MQKQPKYRCRRFYRLTQSAPATDETLGTDHTRKIALAKYARPIILIPELYRHSIGAVSKVADLRIFPDHFEASWKNNKTTQRNIGPSFVTMMRMEILTEEPHTAHAYFSLGPMGHRFASKSSSRTITYIVILLSYLRRRNHPPARCRPRKNDQSV